MRSRTRSLYWTSCLFILNCLIQAGRYRTCSVSAASTNNEKQHNLHYWHSRSKRTPPISFPFLPLRRFGPPMIPTETTGTIGLPGSPLLRSFPTTGLSPFGNGLEPTRFRRPVVGREILNRDFFRRPLRSFGVPRLSSRSSRRSRQGSAPVIIETPDGTQTVFIRDRGLGLPNWSSPRDIPTDRRATGHRRTSHGDAGMPIMSSNLGTGSNPLPTCTSGTVLRCRPWPSGRNPSTANRCYGDCPGRTCFVNCICTCDLEQGPRIMLARMIGPGGLRSKTVGTTSGTSTIGVTIVKQNTRDKTLGGPGGIDAGLSALSRPDVTVDSAVMGVPVPGSAVMDVPVPGSAVSLSVLSSPDVTVDSSVMGLPVPVPGSAISLPAVPGSAISLPAVPGSAISLPAVPGSAISLPALGLTSDNMATSQEPEVSFISTLNVNPTVDVGFSDGAVLTSTNLAPAVAMEAPSGKIEAQGSPLFVDGVAELEVSSTGLKGEGLGVAGMPVAELEVGPLPTAGLSGVSNVIDQSVSDIVLPDTSLDPSLELVNAVTLTDPLNTAPIDALISGSAAPATRGSAPMALAMTLPAPGPAPAPPIKTNGIDLASQLATTFINTKRDSSKAQGLDKVLQVLSNANQTSAVNDVYSLSSLLMALRGEGAVDNTVGSGLDKTAVMSAITGDAAAPLDRLDLLVKDLGLSALFPGGKVDRLFAAGGGIPSSDGLASGSADTSRLAMLQTLLNKGIDGNSFSDNAELALLAATIGGIGGQRKCDTLGGNIMPSNTESKINSALDIPVTGAKGSSNNLKNVLKKGLLMTPGSLGNASVVDTVHTGATTKECLSKGLEIWCDPVTPWGPTPGVTKWCLLNCRDKNNCDRNRCACTCVEEKLFRQKFEKLPIKSP